jgi:pimeloyl-ACP methyl ester carboxylesterase
VGATVEDYRDWLIAELEAIGSPVDLVGHDWGGGHVVAVAMTRPDLLRSWCTDVIGIFDPAYVWHELAQVLQTPDAGEQAVAAWGAESVDERAARLVSLGITPDVARRLATGYDAAMGRCILALYRSAAQPKMAQLGEDLAAAAQRPGLHLSAADDHYAGGSTCNAEPPTEPAPASRYSTDSATGGWCKIPGGGRQRWNASGHHYRPDGAGAVRNPPREPSRIRPRGALWLLKCGPPCR